MLRHIKKKEQFFVILDDDSFTLEIQKSIVFFTLLKIVFLYQIFL